MHITSRARGHLGQVVGGERNARRVMLIIGMDQPTSNWEGRPVSSFKMILQLTASDTNLDRQHFGAIHYTALFFVSYFTTSHFITSEVVNGPQILGLFQV